MTGHSTVPTVSPGRLAAGLAAFLAGCGSHGADARIASLEERIGILHQEVAAQREVIDALRAALREEGMAVPLGEPANAEEAFERLSVATDRMEAAISAHDAASAERANKATREAVAVLARFPGAGDAALERARTAGKRLLQERLVEVAAELGGAGITSRLEEFARDATVPTAARGVAVRSLLMAPAQRARGLAVVSHLLDAAPDFPDLYFLVHVAGETRDPAAVPLLCRALDAGPNPSIRCHAATALANFASSEGTAALAQASRTDPFEAVRINALRALPHAATDAAALTAAAQEALAAAPAPAVAAAAENALALARSGSLPGPVQPRASDR